MSLNPKKSSIIRRNAASARAIWPAECSKSRLMLLRELTTRFGFSVAIGEVQLLNGGWYITHSGLLRLADRRRCHGIQIESVPHFSDPTVGRWVFKATVYKSRRSKGFVGYGDADPSNVSPLVRGAEMRVAETRAVNRALRKAYGIGLCSVEELGWSPRSENSLARSQGSTDNGNGNGNGAHANHPPRLRDRLCLLIRQHRLDPNLVKSYAADFCGTSALRDASRERLEEFVTRLSEQATTDRDALICQLNSSNSSRRCKRETYISRGYVGTVA